MVFYLETLLDWNTINFHLKIETIAKPSDDAAPELDEEAEKELQAAYEHRTIKGEIGSSIVIIFAFASIAVGSVISIGIIVLFFPKTKKKFYFHFDKKTNCFFSHNIRI